MASIMQKAAGSGITLQRSSRFSVVMMPSSRSIMRVAPVRQARVVPRAVDQETTVDTEEIMKDLQTKWDRVENKTQVAIYAVAAVFALWLSSNVVGSINRLPLLPRVFELIGLGYSGWFTYRYLLFKSNRQELIRDIEELKSKVDGKVDDVTDV